MPRFRTLICILFFLFRLRKTLSTFPFINSLRRLKAHIALNIFYADLSLFPDDSHTRSTLLQDQNVVLPSVNQRFTFFIPFHTAGAGGWFLPASPALPLPVQNFHHFTKRKYPSQKLPAHMHIHIQREMIFIIRPLQHIWGQTVQFEFLIFPLWHCYAPLIFHNASIPHSGTIGELFYAKASRVPGHMLARLFISTSSSSLPL